MLRSRRSHQISINKRGEAEIRSNIEQRSDAGPDGISRLAIDIDGLADGIVERPIRIDGEGGAVHATSHADDAIEITGFDAIQSRRHLPGDVDAVLGHDGDRVRCDLSPGMGSRTGGIEAEMRGPAFGHLGTAGVADTDEEDAHVAPYPFWPL